jgi:hypothetical protein
MRRLWQSLSAAALVLAAAFLTGCHTTDSENVSSRPWNSTEGFQGGFPSTLNEGR